MTTMMGRIRGKLTGRTAKLGAGEQQKQQQQQPPPPNQRQNGGRNFFLGGTTKKSRSSTVSTTPSNDSDGIIKPSNTSTPSSRIHTFIRRGKRQKQNKDLSEDKGMVETKSNEAARKPVHIDPHVDDTNRKNNNVKLHVRDDDDDDNVPPRFDESHIVNCSASSSNDVLDVYFDDSRETESDVDVHSINLGSLYVEDDDDDDKNTNNNKVAEVEEVAHHHQDVPTAEAITAAVKTAVVEGPEDGRHPTSTADAGVAPSEGSATATSGFVTKNQNIHRYRRSFFDSDDRDAPAAPAPAAGGDGTGSGPHQDQQKPGSGSNSSPLSIIPSIQSLKTPQSLEDLYLHPYDPLVLIPSTQDSHPDADQERQGGDLQDGQNEDSKHSSTALVEPSTPLSDHRHISKRSEDSDCDVSDGTGIHTDRSVSTNDSTVVTSSAVSSGARVNTRLLDFEKDLMVTTSYSTSTSTSASTSTSYQSTQTKQTSKTSGTSHSPTSVLDLDFPSSAGMTTSTSTTTSMTTDEHYDTASSHTVFTTPLPTRPSPMANEPSPLHHLTYHTNQHTETTHNGESPTSGTDDQSSCAEEEEKKKMDTVPVPDIHTATTVTDSSDVTASASPDRKLTSPDNSSTTTSTPAREWIHPPVEVVHTTPERKIAPSDQSSSNENVPKAGTSSPAQASMERLRALEEKRHALRHQRFSLEQRLYEFRGRQLLEKKSEALAAQRQFGIGELKPEVQVKATEVEADPSTEATTPARRALFTDCAGATPLPQNPEQEKSLTRQQSKPKIVVDWTYKTIHGVDVAYTGPLMLDDDGRPHPDSNHAVLEATLHYADGQVYKGCVEHGLRHGVGHNMWPDGQEYKGEWFENSREGRGTHSWRDGRSVAGEWKGGHLNGKIYFTWPNGSTFDGQAKMGKKCGRGVHKFADGRVYNGHYENGRENGFGTLTLPDGVKYRGQFRNGVKEGYGVMLWKTRTYDGEWVDNKPHGQGRVVWSNGAVYTGQFEVGKYHGLGVYVWPSGKKFVGRWESGIKNGHGLYTWPNGKKYDGEYVDGLKEGYGRMTWADGSMYCGGFKRNKRHGRGVQTDPEGSVVHCGMWKDDFPIDGPNGTPKSKDAESSTLSPSIIDEGETADIPNESLNTTVESTESSLLPPPHSISITSEEKSSVTAPPTQDGSGISASS